MISQHIYVANFFPVRTKFLIIVTNMFLHGCSTKLGKALKISDEESRVGERANFQKLFVKNLYNEWFVSCIVHYHPLPRRIHGSSYDLPEYMKLLLLSLL